MRKPTLLTLFLIVFIDLIGFGLIVPLLPYFGRQFGASGVMIGWLFGIFSLMQFIFSPIWGKLSDRVGRRPILLVSLAGSTSSYLLLGFAHTFWMLFAARMLAGICAANVAVANAYVADITTKENRSKGMGMIGAAFGLGFILGPVLAGLFGRHGHMLPSFIAAGISGSSLLLAFFALPESKEKAALDKPAPAWSNHLQDWQTALALPLIGALVCTSFLTSMAFSKWETTFALFLQGNPYFHYSIRTVGLFFAYLGVLTALMQGGLVGRLVKRFGEPTLLKIGIGMVATAFFLMPLCRSLGQIMGCLTILGLGSGMLRPVLFGVSSILTSVDRQGLILGVVQGAGSLGRIAGPLLGGWMFDKNPGLPFWSAGLAMLLALALTPPSRKVYEAKAETIS